MHACRGWYSVRGIKRPVLAAASSICRANRSSLTGSMFSAVCAATRAPLCCGIFSRPGVRNRLLVQGGSAGSPRPFQQIPVAAHVVDVAYRLPAGRKAVLGLREPVLLFHNLK